VTPPGRYTCVLTEKVSGMHWRKRPSCLAIYTESFFIRRDEIFLTILEDILEAINLSIDHHFVTEKYVPNDGMVIVHRDREHG
jgi:hypothetical protein